jgi:hypothetical protein
MPVPLPVPRVPPGFPLRAAAAPSTPWITAASDPTGYQGGQTAPSGGPITWGASTAPAASPGVGPPPRAWPT